MAHITLRPEFRTAGGEVNDLEIDGQYAGTLTLTYRERDRLIGAVQLDRTTLSPDKREAVSLWADDYVHSLADALRVEECEVLVTFSRFDHIITSFNEEMAEAERIGARDVEYDDDPFIVNDEHAREGKDSIPVRLELVIVGESDNRVEYHIYGKNKAWKAEAFFNIEETEVSGEVNWMVKPSDNEMEAAVDLIVSDFDEKAIDAFRIEMKYRDEILETIGLTHEDMLAHEEKWQQSRGNKQKNRKERQYTAVLVRDDTDALTYDIYEQTRGGLPIGRATIDISNRQLTGYIDFREPTGSYDRELMAASLLRELDKEKDYDSLNLTMIHRNKRIEDIYFENDQTL